MTKELSQKQVDSEDDSSREPTASPEPKPSKSKSKKRAKVESEEEEEEEESDSDSERTKKKPKKKAVKSDKPDKKPVKSTKKDKDEEKSSSKSKAKSKKAAESDEVELLENNDGDAYVELGGTKRATVRVFKGNIGIDIRETYSKDGKDGLPGKKGINLNLEQYERLKESIQAVRTLFLPSSSSSYHDLTAGMLLHNQIDAAIAKLD
ncbi:hypothetical protein JCM16303_004403 [Sporobolomyces ruberrimus]